MLHGRTQVNIAPRRVTSVQYVETDRQVKRCRWRDQRDDGASANVPYQEGKLKEGKQKCQQRPAPIQRNHTVSTLWNLETPS